jgi:Ca2+-binding EF-hand superfamily protein
LPIDNELEHIPNCWGMGASSSPEVLLNNLSTAAKSGTLDLNSMIQMLGKEAGLSPETSEQINNLLAATQDGTINTDSLIQMLEKESGLSPETAELVNNLSTAAQNGTLDANNVVQMLGKEAGLSPETAELVNNLSTAAQNGTLDADSVVQMLGKEIGIPTEVETLSDYEVKAGWEKSYSTTHSGSDEIAPGIELDSKASYKADVFVGVSSEGDAGAEWNSDQAHIHARTRSMIGVEASQEASYEGRLNIEGLGHQPGVDANAHSKAMAGAELEGTGDILFTKDTANANASASTFAGVKAEAGAGGALSIDGNEFAKAEGEVGAYAGAGAKGGIDMGYQDGQINFGMDAGIGLGLGVEYSYKVAVDAPGIITHPDVVIESVYDEVKDVAQQVQEYLPPVPEVIKPVVEVITNPINDLGDGIADVFGW